MAPSQRQLRLQPAPLTATRNRLLLSLWSAIQAGRTQAFESWSTHAGALLAAALVILQETQATPPHFRAQLKLNRARQEGCSAQCDACGRGKDLCTGSECPRRVCPRTRESRSHPRARIATANKNAGFAEVCLTVPPPRALFYISTTRQGPNCT